MKKVKKKFGFKWGYEVKKIKFIQPEKHRTYLPDFLIETANGKRFFVETKGRFMVQDRQKHLWIKEQSPDLDIRFLFGRDDRISKGSKTRYSTWCIKHGFKFAISKNEIPEEWLNE